MKTYFKYIAIIIIQIITVTKVTSAQSVWQWQSPQPTGNFMWALDFVDENTGYAAGDVGTVMKTTNGGMSWESKIVDMNFRAYGMHFYDADFGFLCGTDNGKLYRTTNGGENWTVVLTAGVTMWDVDFPTRHTGYAVGLNGRIYKSTDSGLNWTQQSGGTNTFLFSVDFIDSLNGAIGGGRILLKTTNGGLNWVAQNLTFNQPFSQVFSLNYIDQNHIYGLVASEDSLYKTTNGGQSWFGQVIQRLDSDINRTISFINPNTGIMATDYGRIKRTTNAGVTWIIDETFKPNYPQIGVLLKTEFVNNSIAYVSGSGGRVIKSTNGGQNWFTTTGGRYNYNSNFFINQNTGFTAGNDGKILKTTNAGLNWIEKQSNTIQNLNEVTFADENTGYVCGDTGTVLKTTDGGENWEKLSINVNVNLNSIDFLDLQTGIVVGKEGKILKTTNSGSEWITINSGVTSELLELNFPNTQNNSTGYIIDEIRTLKSTDRGNTWSLILNGGGIGMYFVDSLTGYSTGGSGIILKTTNGSINWITQSGGVIDNLNGIYFIDKNNGYSAGNGGAVTKTTNGGTTWIPQTRLTNNNLNSVFFTDADNGYITGDFGTLIKTTNGGLVFISSNSETTPEDFALYQNYPNPFNSSTVIRYEINRPGNVELKLYDITGKLVSTLVKEVQERGSYSVLFSPESNEMQLQSGVYFYTLKYESENILTKKLLYIK
ncbi:MAG TPA: YCF48-related protein [Ignavibacteria bacterium]|nr:YCF48-related protein [Ignavibacteria bacterium]